MIQDERGITHVETLVAVPVLFVVFACMFLFAHLCAAHLIVRRAASAAARAAVVFLPDDPVYYGSEGAATKEQCVRQAVRQVLVASPQFKIAEPNLEVTITGARSVWAPTTVTVRAQYDCSKFLGGYFLCGTDRVAHIKAEATLSYQEGPIEDQRTGPKTPTS